MHSSKYKSLHRSILESHWSRPDQRSQHPQDGDQESHAKDAGGQEAHLELEVALWWLYQLLRSQIQKKNRQFNQKDIN